MKRIRFLMAVSIALPLCVFSSCGDLDMALSPGKVYKVNAMINGRSLDDCAVLSLDSEIEPYFDFNIKSDPDISALAISLKNSLGKETGLRIKYALPSYVAAGGGTTSTNSGEKTETTAGTNVTAGTISSTENETSGKTGVSSEENLAGGDESSGGNVPSTVDEKTETGGGDAKQGETGAEDGDGLLAGTAGALETESGGKPAFGVENEQFNEPVHEALIVIENFYNELPALKLGSELPEGFYTIVFDVISSNGAVLNSVEKPFFYLADKRLVIKGIVSYLPGVASITRILPPGEKIMLETEIDASDGISPYIIWYNGKQKISEGFISDGAERIFWVAPTQNGFQNIRAEVFPFDPTKHYQLIHGLSHSVSLPVSQKHGRTGYYNDIEIQLSRWYRLWGNFTDARDPANPAAELIKVGDAETLWLPLSGGAYGLAVGAENEYKLPGSFFKYIRQGEGSGELLFRFSPRSGSAKNPVIAFNLRGVFELQDVEEEGECAIYLSLTEENLEVKAVYREEVQHIRMPLIIDDSGFVSVAVDFQFFEKNTVISIGIEEAAAKKIENWESIDIEFMADGNGSIQFGGIFETSGSDEDNGEIPVDGTGAIFTEIAALYPPVSPVLEVVEEKDEQEDAAVSPETVETEPQDTENAP
ncbi:MAG: hypothetical protein LBB22_01710 [Treponema sp.]|jgi:hypothetical protein|nr:hypothetical protein [Treponema sp.]